jgi:plastocyanin
MLYTTFALSALASLASARTFAVEVGVINGTAAQKFFPEKIVAAPGDTIQFQFRGGNHTLTQSTFDNPCEPIALHSNVTGIYSGFMPIAAGAQSIPVFTVPVNDTRPMWFYCSQGRHCQNGMVMVVNENTAANASRSLDNFKVAAAQAPNNLPGGILPGGVGVGGNGQGGIPIPTDGSNGQIPGANPNGAASHAAPAALALVGVVAALFM